VEQLRKVELSALLELRERVLTPGHPNRPVIWPYDNEQALHYGLFVDEELVGCVSITPQDMPGRRANSPFHLHSMAVEPTSQCRGLGRRMLDGVLCQVRDRGGDLVWATARPTAVGFYQQCGFEAGDEMRVAPTNAPMRYVWFVVSAHD
jgi:GNAT superfamily N-acetyltransferase